MIFYHCNFILRTSYRYLLECRPKLDSSISTMELHYKTLLPYMVILTNCRNCDKIAAISNFAHVTRAQIGYVAMLDEVM